MGKTPKSKNVNYRSKSHLQPKVAQHRPKNYGAEKLSFPGKSDQCAPTKRRMDLGDSLSRKPSQVKGFSIKVKRPSSTANGKESEKTQSMSVVTADVSEAISIEPQPVIFENGKEDSQEKEEEIDSKDLPSISNGSQPESTKVSKSDIDESVNTSNKQIQDGNSVEDTITDGEGNPSLKLSKDDEGEAKKQRPGTPQSRSSTPQRKSERVRSKQGSPSKLTPTTNLSPALKILKINLTPCKSSTNGTVLIENSTKVVNEDSIKSKKKDIEIQEKVDSGIQIEIDTNDSQAIDKESDEVFSVDKDMPKPQTESNAPYLRSLRLMSGRRSLTSRSPYSSPSIFSSFESSTVLTTQWKKKQSHKKDGAHLKDDSESEYQDTENEFHTSTISGKRKAERVDDQASKLAVSSLKKPKSEDDDLRLYLPDGGERESSLEKDLGESEFVDDHRKGNTSKQSSSADYDDEIEEFKDLPDKCDKDESFINDESMEFVYEKRESYVKSQDSPTASNQSSNKRWCILM